MSLYNSGKSKKIICLDYDDTYTSDPQLFNIFIEAAHTSGHKVLLTTWRFGFGWEMKEVAEDYNLEKFIQSEKISLVFCSRKSKREHLKHLGYNVDDCIWIDDNPFAIVMNAGQFEVMLSGDSNVKLSY